MTELEQLGADTSPATNAYRARIRARNAEHHADRSRTETQLADLETATAQDSDPTLLDELPYLSGILDRAPEPLIEKLLAALDIQCLYRKDKNQVTIHPSTPPSQTPPPPPSPPS